MERLRIALIRGDGIGPELVDAALRVLEAVGETDGLEFAYTEVNAGAGAYRETGTACAPEDVELMCTGVDATLKGPVGLPDVRHPDGTEVGLLGGILRTGLQVYANVRPVLQLPGVQGRLVGHEPGSIDYVIVRENTEGLYASRGKGVGNRWAVADTMIVTREGTLLSTTITAYLTTFLIDTNGLSTTAAQNITIASNVVVIAATLAAGPLADRIGLRRSLTYAGLVVAVLAIPALGLAAQGTAGGLAYNVTQAVFGGTGPAIGVWLNHRAGAPYGFAAYLTALALVTAVAYVGRDVFDRRYTPTADGERRVPSDRFTREPAAATDRAALRR